MDPIEAALVSSGPLDQQLLSSLARRSLKQYLQPKDGEPIIEDLSTLWTKLRESTLAKSMPEKHLTAACNAVSVFVVAAAGAPSDMVRNFVFSESRWDDASACVEYAFGCGKTKAALQVLQTLAQLSKQQPDTKLACELVEKNAKSVISSILTNIPVGGLKSACISLSCFIKKTQLMSTLEDLVYSRVEHDATVWKQRRLENQMPRKDHSSKGEAMQELFLALLFAVNNLETRSAALKLFSLLCSQPIICAGHAMRQAADVLEQYIGCNPDLLSDFADNVLPVILDERSQFEAFLKIYSSGFSQSESRLILYLAVLKAGRMKNFISEEDLTSVLSSGMQEDIDDNLNQRDKYQGLTKLLRAGNANVRIHSYDLITASFATKAAIPKSVLNCVLGSLKYIHDDNNAYDRGELLGITRRFLKRLSNSYVSLLRLRSADKISEENIERIADYEQFAGNFALFLSNELENGISYPRHILALQSLQQLSKTPFIAWLDNAQLQTRVTALVSNPYDDVRAVSSEMLTVLYSRTTIFDQDKRRGICDQSIALASQTCRHDHADAAGRMLAVSLQTMQTALPTDGTTINGADSAVRKPAWEIMNRLQAHVDDVSQLRPDSGFPLHAYVLALSYTLSNGVNAEMSSCVLQTCSRIWALVKVDLCVDSPETGTEDLEDDGLRGPKDLLAYAWRALRDSSVLLQSLVKADRTHIEEAGSLCMEQLTQLRHRGAFSTVAQTFALCCDLARASPDERIQYLILQWRTLAFAEIDLQANKVTRRSAGIPAMFNAILSPADPDMFDDVISSLKAKGTQGVSQEELQSSEQSLPQVHALNCIKDIIVNSKFRATAEKHITSLLVLAADRMSSDLWAIRNCGLMLLRACIMRLDSKLLGSVPSEPAIRRSEESDLSPTEVALMLLRNAESELAISENASRGSEKIFAGLDLIKHIGASRRLDSTTCDLMRRQFKNPIWGIRDHAARVLATQEARYMSWEELAVKFRLSRTQSENELHGQLLYLRYAFAEVADQIESSAVLGINTVLASSVEEMSIRRSERPISPIVDATFLDIVNAVLRTLLLRLSGSPHFCKFTPGSSINSPWDTYTGRAYYRQRYLLYRIICCIMRQENSNAAQLLLPLLPDDPDIMEYIASYMWELSTTLSSESIQTIIGQVVVHLCLQIESETALTILFTTLATGLENGRFSPPVVKVMELLDKCAALPPHRSRNLQNSSIRLRGALIGLSLHSNARHGPLVTDLAADIARASQDQLDYPTRMAGAQAASSCVENVFLWCKNQTSGASTGLALRLLTILYDQLNDDDEEIRELAQEATHRVARLAVGRVYPFRECALAARETLRRMTLEHYRLDTMLPHIATARVLGSDLAYGPDQDIFNISVATRLAGITMSMNDLFSEERQNLYIDELEEIRRWCGILQCCPANTDWWTRSAQWCLDGIPVLRAAIEKNISDEQTVRLLDNFDTLELCMRVAHLSRALLEKAKMEQSQVLELGKIQGELQQECQKWQEELQRADAPVLLVEAIREGE